MKQLILILFLVTFSTTSSQTKITGFFDGKIELSFQISKKTQTAIRINDDLGKEFSTAIHFQYQFVKKDNYNLNFGVGIVTNPFSNNIRFLESVYFPLQIEITPFKGTRNFALVLESAYHTAKTDAISGIRNSIGIRYVFKSIK